jgi:hypothetical protein
VCHRYSDEQVCLVEVLQEACNRANEQAPLVDAGTNSTMSHEQSTSSDCQEVLMQLQVTNQLIQVG